MRTWLRRIGCWITGYRAYEARIQELTAANANLNAAITSIRAASARAEEASAAEIATVKTVTDWFAAQTAGGPMFTVPSISAEPPPMTKAPTIHAAHAAKMAAAVWQRKLDELRKSTEAEAVQKERMS